MNISPIKNCSAFNGLMSDEVSYKTDAGPNFVKDYRKRTYYPFADETELCTAYAIKKGSYNYSYSLDIDNSCTTDVLVTTEKGKTLPFTEKEYNNYKKFLGKDMPEQIAAVKNALIEYNLTKYINKGPIFAVKKFLHTLKIIK